ncbi:MAG: DNA repair protein RadC [Candidatus Omnitrophica bacterium]|nr:DNA repair protein RadC [Candidatus Omnitrophota bacterium]
MAENRKLMIRNLARVERPREKLIHYGPARLSNKELLAIILRTGGQNENALDLAGRVIRNCKSENLADISYAEIRKISGIGPAKACEILACFELGRRFLKGKISSLFLKPEDVWKELKDIRELKKEHFIVFYLDSRNQEIEREIISVGSLNASLVHPREVFEPAVRIHAAQVILAHNHPSGNPEPSRDDLEINRRLVEAGKILGIEVIDHIIVTVTGYLSFKEKNLI